MGDVIDLRGGFDDDIDEVLHRVGREACAGWDVLAELTWSPPAVPDRPAPWRPHARF